MSIKKNSFYVLFFLNSLDFFAQENLLSLEGSYQGMNLIVSNPPQADGFGYCINKVTVNGEILPAIIQTTNFQIDFSLFQLKMQEQLFIVLEHNEGCVPKFINPEVLLPKSTFVCEKITAQKNGVISWTTKNEKQVLDFTIEQFRWNKWLSIGEVRGMGGPSLNKYSFQISPHSGKNRIRVSQIDNTGIKRVSPETSFNSSVAIVRKSPAKVSEYIYFKSNQKTTKTKFELWDAFGNLLKVGVSEAVDCSNLVNGVYFINFDNTTEKFIKIEK
jgi:hypothetical protein